MDTKLFGELILLPADFGEGTETTDLIPPRTLALANSIRIFAVENERTARRYLRRLGFEEDFESVKMILFDKYADQQTIRQIIQILKQGNDVGFLSEAGMPCIADPGSTLVEAAHLQGITVQVIPGPSSIFMTIAASGLNGQSFSFTGYLPIEKSDRKQRILELEKQSQRGNAIFFIETPYRSESIAADILKYCDPDTLFTIGCEVGIKGGWVLTKSIKSWQQKRFSSINKKMCVFGIQALPVKIK